MIANTYCLIYYTNNAISQIHRQIILAEALIECLRGPSDGAREAASAALALLTPHLAAFVPRLLACLKAWYHCHYYCYYYYVIYIYMFIIKLQADDAEPRIAAARLLGKLSAHAKA